MVGWMVDKWASAVVTLSTVAVAERYSQTAYAGFTFCMQNEWQYVQRVVADTALFFLPLEEVIRKHFLPAISSPTASSWGGWQFATLWTPPRVFTRPLFWQLAT